MDVRIEAAPMVADAEVVDAVVTVETVPVFTVIVAPSQVASFSCPSLGSHSLSAVAPDHILRNGGLARAA